MRVPVLPALFVGAAVTVLACDDPFGLPLARIPNTVDTVSLYALRGTPLTLPSGYYVEFRLPVRTDTTVLFDFVFDIDAGGQAQLLPTGALGLGRASGIKIVDMPFDAVTMAPPRPYVDSTAVAVTAGTVAVLHSRPSSCSFLSTVFFYAKLRVLAIDPVERRIDFEILADVNCGYRGLEPGLPRR